MIAIPRLLGAHQVFDGCESLCRRSMFSDVRCLVNPIKMTSLTDRGLVDNCDGKVVDMIERGGEKSLVLPLQCLYSSQTIPAVKNIIAGELPVQQTTSSAPRARNTASHCPLGNEVKLNSKHLRFDGNT